MSARWWVSRILVLGWILAGCLMLGESVTSAAVTHEYLSQITEVPALGPDGEAIASPGELGDVGALALDSGHLWLAEQREGLPRIDEFDAASGAFLSQLGIGSVGAGLTVAHANGDIYVPSDEESSGVVLVLDAAGSLIDTWTGADTESKTFGCFGCGGNESLVAVDDSTVLGDWAAGDVYVTDVTNDVVDVFEPEPDGKERLAAELKGTSPSEPFIHPQQIAVSAFNGDVLVGDTGAIDIFKPAAIVGQYEFVGKLVGPPSGSFTQIRSLAVDGSDGDVYVAEAEAQALEAQALYEFDATGAYLGKLAGADTPAGNFHILRSLAVDSTTDRLFVGDYREGHGNAVDVFGPNLVVPDVTTGSALGVGPFAATLTGTVNPDKAGNATCQFVWGTSTALLGSPLVACSQSVADGGSPVAVQGALTGLQPDTTYYYRLQATNALGTNVGEGSDDREFTTSGPGIREEGASDVASTSVSLNAAIDPHGLNTTYYFQYGPSTAYGTDVPTLPGVSIGSGEGPVDVVQHVQEGLSPGATYHYRVVVLSELEPGKLEAFAGPDQTFRTQAAGGSGLPDGRAWEMVSSPNKLGARLEPAPVHEGGLTQAAVDGGGIAYTASAPTEEGQGNTSLEHIQLLASRGSAGWDTKVIATPHEAASGLIDGSLSEYLLFSPDLSLGMVEPKGETPLSAEASERTPYLRHDQTCQSNPGACYQPLVTAGNVLPGTKFGGDPKNGFGEVIVEGASPDLSHIVLESAPPLTAVPVEHALYEWSAGRLRLLTFSPGGSKTGLEGQSTLGAGQANTRHAVSDDGSRIVWTQGVGTASALYMRNAAKGEGETVQLDSPQPGANGGRGEPVFQTASSEGSRVFFTDTARLTISSRASEDEPDLYEYDVETGSLTDLSVDLNKNESADVQDLVQGASEDGSYVYFVAKGVLATGARPGANNLYMHHAGATTLVGILSDDDGENEGGTIAKQLVALTASVSPDGRWLAFMSDESLTGYNNHDVNSGVRDEEVFLYDAASKRLACASCNPTGARPVGTFALGNPPAPLFDNSLVWHARWLAGGIPSWISSNAARGTYQSRYLSNSGRLFFDSSDGLSPDDTNGTWDVYEYEPGGNGDCENASATFEEAADGCVGLISSGGSADESTFMDASEDGSEAFFLTTSQLVSQDDDHALDLYDARVCSASSPCFPAAPVSSPPCSTSDSCKPASSPQPESFGAPSSETFAGMGNIAAPKGTPIVASRSLTRAQKLSRALKACRKRPKRKQAACERHARKLYGKRGLGKQAAAGKHARPVGPGRGRR